MANMLYKLMLNLPTNLSGLLHSMSSSSTSWISSDLTFPPHLVCAGLVSLLEELVSALALDSHGFTLRRDQYFSSGKAICSECM